MTINKNYKQRNHPVLNKLNIVNCYLCNKKLTGEITDDHIIPKGLFKSGSDNRPELPVHKSCNNIKSKEDKWCKYYIQLIASLHPEAEASLIKLLRKANEEKRFAYEPGKSAKIPNYKIALGMFGKMTPGLLIQHRGKTLHTLKPLPELGDRVNNYLKAMCRGLYIRNVPGSNPPPPSLMWNLHAHDVLRGKGEEFMEKMSPLFKASATSAFNQGWDDRIMYVGSRVKEDADRGFIFVIFYDQVGLLASFGVKGLEKPLGANDANV